MSLPYVSSTVNKDDYWRQIKKNTICSLKCIKMFSLSDTISTNKCDEDKKNEYETPSTMKSLGKFESK